MNNSNLNKNNIYNSIATFTNLLFPLVTFPYITRVLGIDNIGKYNFSNSVVSYFNLIATLGISSYAIRECAKVKNDRKTMSELASDIFSIDLYSTFIAYILLFIALLFSVKLKSYAVYILLLSTSFIINTLGTTWICNSVDDFKYLSIRTIIVRIISLLAFFVFVRNENHLCRYILIIVFCNTGSNVFCFFYRQKYVDIRFKLLPNIKRHLKKIILMFSQTVSILLYTNADMIMLGYYYNDETVGIYAIAVKIYNIVNSVIASVINVAVPGLSYDYSCKDYDGFNKKITYIVNYILLLFLPAFFGLNLMSGEIVRLVSGRFIPGSQIALQILTISLLFSLISATLGIAILFPMGYDRVNFNSCIISATSNILLNFYFIPKFGVVGAAITTAIAEFVGFINKIKYIDKNIKVQNFWTQFLKYAIGSILVAIVCIVFKRIVSESNCRSIVTIAISCLVYFGYLLLIKDEFFLNLVSPVLKKIRLIR